MIVEEGFMGGWRGGMIHDGVSRNKIKHTRERPHKQTHKVVR